MENFLVHLVIIVSILAVGDFWAKSLLKNRGYNIYFFSLTGRFKNLKHLYRLASKKDSDGTTCKFVFALNMLGYVLFIALFVAAIITE